MASILNLFKLVSDPTRLRILTVLEVEPLSVAEMQDILGMGQSRISSQLSLLKKGGLVSDQRVGKNNIYSSQLQAEVKELIAQAASEIPESQADREKLDYILMKRRDQARAYFDNLAGKFGKNYVPGRSWKSLSEGLLKITNYGVVVDLGAGEGTLSQLIAQHSDQVIAVDHSEKMVEYGRQLAVEHKLENLEYRLGDLQNPPIDESSADLVIFSQALHHASDPARALQKAYSLLKKGGRLLVLDLLEHHFDQARELYGDLWLGFAEIDLVRMARSAGFSQVSSTIVDREDEPPHFQTLMLVGTRTE